MAENPTLTVPDLWALVRETENGFRFLGDLVLGYDRKNNPPGQEVKVAAMPSTVGKKGQEQPASHGMPAPGVLGGQNHLADQTLGYGLPEPGVLGQQACPRGIICDCYNPPGCTISAGSVRALLAYLFNNAKTVSNAFTQLLAGLPDDEVVAYTRTTVLGVNWLETEMADAKR